MKAKLFFYIAITVLFAVTETLAQTINPYNYSPYRHYNYSPYRHHARYSTPRHRQKRHSRQKYCLRRVEICHYSGKGNSLWSAVKNYLGPHASNAEILKTARIIATKEDINVPEWGIFGKRDAKLLSQDFIKKLFIKCTTIGWRYKKC